MSEYFSDVDSPNDTKDEDKPFQCSGCKTALGKYDEKCPNCERLNPHYCLR